MFKFLGHTQFLEVFASSKEIVLFHENGFVLLRFDWDFNQSSIVGSCSDIMVDERA